MPQAAQAVFLFYYIHKLFLIHFNNISIPSEWWKSKKQALLHFLKIFSLSTTKTLISWPSYFNMIKQEP